MFDLFPLHVWALIFTVIVIVIWPVSRVLVKHSFILAVYSALRAFSRPSGLETIKSIGEASMLSGGVYLALFNWGIRGQTGTVSEAETNWSTLSIFIIAVLVVYKMNRYLHPEK